MTHVPKTEPHQLRALSRCLGTVGGEVCHPVLKCGFGFGLGLGTALAFGFAFCLLPLPLAGPFPGLCVISLKEVLKAAPRPLKA